MQKHTTFKAPATPTTTDLLPPLTKTQVPLSNTTSLTLVHVSDPKSGTFSKSKKQCDLWEYVWGTSLLFCRLLYQLPLHAHMSVLEVGCGSALCGLSCALKGATVLSTDLVKDSVTIAQQSATANGITNITFDNRNWEKLPQFETNHFDIVLGSDVLFYRGAAPYVAKVIHQSMKEHGCALIADPVRLNVDDFCSRLDDLGCVTYVRQFIDSNVSIANIGVLTEEKKSFVKLTKAKLVVVERRPRGEENKKGGSFSGGGSASTSANAIVNAILAMTEPFVPEEE